MQTNSDCHLREAADISLLLTDIHMPGSMDGLKLAHAVRRFRPGNRLERQARRLPTGSRFFRKSYEPTEFVSELRLMAA